jgi:hypothetical protein
MGLRMAAGALFRDRQGRPLLVDRFARAHETFPVVRSPNAAFRREVAEELGRDRSPSRVQAVDWVP